ncbi:type VII secretion-associated serine protease mycosin [Mycolicibacterium arenosum]|uniref:Type VII secretion-associated serine protease mycosin n=1 Tax=Mycolicibacterium arenosum TaxID=2952157 RepID=A0ABT1LY99_9MYCO|nr:type VII secretion-associated serine protease mycosin [Mycolicibacterium sp. CAU 1645]MCP9271565.1 type VII secretion-associated serine protease mycosin [Mycolicibacterium sp. CAU 1645]
MTTRLRRWFATSGTAGLVACLAAAPPVHAVAPPVVAPGPPPTGPVAPPQPTERITDCGVTAILPQSDFGLAPHAAQMLALTEAWRFSRGAGQRVAVIDTGVSRHPRLPALEAGGDYVSSGDGLEDCDAHGTLVAGIIAAAPSPDDAFAGVAPEATILSIRQHSGAYDLAGTRRSDDDPNAVSSGYGDIITLARAITRAVDLGATVINLSVAACVPVGTPIDDADLGRAVRYAFERDVVVVAAAGNIDPQGLCGVQNPAGDPNLPLEREWASVQTVVSPAWYSDYVLTVGALTPNGEPAEFSVRGPWVDVAAPGEMITSLDPRGPGLMNAWQDQRGIQPVNGTSFAAPFVSGAVALLRSRFPDLSAAQVMEVIKRTAHTAGGQPSADTGFGVVDPVAALTYLLPPVAALPDRQAPQPIARPPQPESVDLRARNIALTVSGACIAIAAVALGVLPARRRSAGGGDGE